MASISGASPASSTAARGWVMTMHVRRTGS
jgi:hypothetical protein